MVTYEEPSKEHSVHYKELSEKCTNSLMVQEPPVSKKVCIVGAQYNNCTVNIFSGAQGYQLIYPPMAFPPAMSHYNPYLPFYMTFITII